MRHAFYFTLFLPVSLCAQTANESRAAIAFLTSLQQPDGGFVAAPNNPKSSLRGTSAAIRAIKYLGGDVPNKDKALEFVKSCYNADTGAFADTPGGAGDVNVTAIGMMATAALQKNPRLDKSVEFLAKNAQTFEERRLAVAGMEAAGKFDSVIKNWFVEVEKSANSDGTFGKADGQARDTGGVTAMLLRAGVKLPADRRKAIVATLIEGQRPDGAFGKADEKGSDTETTYRVMRAFDLLNEKPKDVVKIQQFVEKCRNADGGYGIAPKQPSSAGGTYYAVMIQRWLAPY